MRRRVLSLLKELDGALARLKKPPKPRMPLVENIERIEPPELREAVERNIAYIKYYYEMDNLCTLTLHALGVIDDLLEELEQPVQKLKEEYGPGYIRLKTVRNSRGKKYTYLVYTVYAPRRDIYLPKNMYDELLLAKKLKKLRRRLLSESENVCNEASRAKAYISRYVIPIQ